MAWVTSSTPARVGSAPVLSLRDVMAAEAREAATAAAEAINYPDLQAALEASRLLALPPPPPPQACGKIIL